MVDEGQDMQADWALSLISLARPDARVLWLEDPSQSLYAREPVELPGWTVLSSPVNYRSPRLLVDFINWMQLTDEPVEAGGAIEGFDPIWETYPDAQSQVPQTEAVVRELIQRGFAPANIAVLSYRGLSKSLLAGADGPSKLAGITVRRPAGYDPEGNARFSAGDLLVDTLHRFKGQAADAVVITEIDLDAFDDKARRRLFVGLSRARLHAALVTTQTAAGVLLRQME